MIWEKRALDKKKKEQKAYASKSNKVIEVQPPYLTYIGASSAPVISPWQTIDDTQGLQILNNGTRIETVRNAKDQILAVEHNF